MSDKIREALEFYANGDHLLLADPDAWDTCSGEPMNWLHDSAGTASVEDGSIAKAALAQQPAPMAVPDTFSHDNKPLERLLNATALLVEAPCADSGVYFAACLADVDAMLSATHAAPADDDDECVHEFVPFQAGCTKCGEPYAAPAAPVAVGQEPVGKVLSEEEMGIHYDRRMGPVVWFGTPKPGFIYAAPLAAEQPGTIPVRRELLKEVADEIAYQDQERIAEDKTGLRMTPPRASRLLDKLRALLAGGEA